VGRALADGPNERKGACRGARAGERKGLGLARDPPCVPVAARFIALVRAAASGAGGKGVAQGSRSGPVETG